MLKYVFPVICLCLFFMLPMKDLKDENKVLNEEIFYLESEIYNKDKNIDSLKNEIFILRDKLKVKKIKPINKKPKTETPDTTSNKQLIINDTLKTT